VGAHRNEAAVRGSLALLETAEGDYEGAREHYAAALQIQREAGNRRSEGILHGNLADLLLAHDELDEARQHLGHCLQRAQETGARGVEGAFLGSLGELELRCGRMAQAEVALEAGEAQLRALDVPLELAKLLGRRAQLSIQTGHPEHAEALLNEVVQISDQLSLAPDSEIRVKVQQIRAKIRGS